jgi:hypothetical protein
MPKVSPRGCKIKGSRFEREIVNRLRDEGIIAARLPLSGAMRGKYGGCDVTLTMLDREHRAELKHHGIGFQRLYNWLRDGVHLLIVRQDRSEPLVVLPFNLFVELIKK